VECGDVCIAVGGVEFTGRLSPPGRISPGDRTRHPARAATQLDE